VHLVVPREADGLARLHEKEYISDPSQQERKSSKTKHVVFRYQGLAESERLVSNLFGRGRSDRFRASRSAC